MLMSTSPADRQHEVLGIVCATGDYSSSGFFRSSDPTSAALGACLKTLDQRAREMGADAVICIQFQFDAGGGLSVTAVGTAIRFT